METMYDKLGDLLSQTLAEGKVKFVKVEKTQAAENSDSDIADERKKLDDDLKRAEENEGVPSESRLRKKIILLLL